MTDVLLLSLYIYIKKKEQPQTDQSTFINMPNIETCCFKENFIANTFKNASRRFLTVGVGS